jgi:hypothetical protein
MAVHLQLFLPSMAPAGKVSSVAVELKKCSLGKESDFTMLVLLTRKVY